MKKDYKHFLGVDVSKKTLDLALILNHDKNSIVYTKINNTAVSIRGLSNWLTENGVDFDDVLLCMEFTGVYNRPLLNFIMKKNCAVWLVMPVAIKRSIGLQRGKNDKVDAKRIAIYACMFQQDYKPWKPASENITLLKDLISLRQRLIKSEKILRAPIKELKAMKEIRSVKAIEQNCKGAINQLQKDLKAVQNRIQEIITSDTNLITNYKLLLSIPGIGPFTALDLICYTNNFEYYNEGKQLACYAGTAPFEHTSGTSIRGKTRVSNMANHNLKTNLTLGAWAVIRANGFLRKYYERKLAEGKEKMSVINAVRNKLIHIATAVIRNQTPIDKNYVSPVAA